MRIEIKPRKSVIHTKRIKDIKAKFEAAGLFFDRTLIHKDSKAKTTSYKRRIMKKECNKLIEVGCVIVRKVYDSEKQCWYLKETSQETEKKSEPKKVEPKILKLPEVFKGFSGNICAGFDVKFK